MPSMRTAVLKNGDILNKSLIVVGDFNCEFEDGSALQMLAEKLSLSAYQAGAEDMITSE